MKSLKCKNLFIVIIIYLLVTFFILSNIRIYKNIVDLVFWGCISIYLIYCIKNGYIRCKCDKIVGAEIHLDFPSVGATENIILASVFAERRNNFN